MFVDQIKLVYWRNKLAASTLNIAAGEAVTEIEVFEVRLNDPQLDEAVLKQIDKEIPYHILFILTCDGKAQAWIGYKEAAASGSNAFKVSRYYHTDWMPEDELHLSIDGLNMDAVYESLVRQIAGEKLLTDSGESLKESVERDEKKKQLEKQIAALENKMRREEAAEPADGNERGVEDAAKVFGGTISEFIRAPSINFSLQKDYLKIKSSNCTGFISLDKYWNNIIAKNPTYKFTHEKLSKCKFQYRGESFGIVSCVLHLGTRWSYRSSMMLRR